MIKKLRIKLILITMISVIAVLAIIMTTINVSNYVKTTNDIDLIMDKLIEHGGSFDDFIPNDSMNNNRIRINNDSTSPFSPGEMGRETPFETRYPAKGNITSEGKGILQDSIAIKSATPHAPIDVITLSIQLASAINIVLIIIKLLT